MLPVYTIWFRPIGGRVFGGSFSAFLNGSFVINYPILVVNSVLNYTLQTALLCRTVVRHRAHVCVMQHRRPCVDVVDGAHKASHNSPIAIGIAIASSGSGTSPSALPLALASPSASPSPSNAIGLPDIYVGRPFMTAALRSCRPLFDRGACFHTRRAANTQAFPLLSSQLVIAL